MRSLSIVAPGLVPGDLLVSSGIGGACGLVTRVSVLPTAVGVWLADGQVHSLGLLEACEVMRADCQHEDDGGMFYAKCRKCGEVLDDYAGGV